MTPMTSDLSGLRERVSPPADGGLAMVPREPAKEQIAAYIAADPRRRRFAASAKRDYRAMISAAPAAPPVDLGAMREEIAKLVHRAQLGSAKDFTRTAAEWADVILTILQARVAPLEFENTELRRQLASEHTARIAEEARVAELEGERDAYKSRGEMDAQWASQAEAALAVSQRECEGLREALREIETGPSRNAQEVARLALVQSTISQGEEK